MDELKSTVQHIIASGRVVTKDLPSFLEELCLWKDIYGKRKTACFV